MRLSSFVPRGQPLSNPIFLRRSTRTRVYLHDVTRQIPFPSGKALTEESLIPADGSRAPVFLRLLHRGGQAGFIRAVCLSGGVDDSYQRSLLLGHPGLSVERTVPAEISWSPACVTFLFPYAFVEVFAVAYIVPVGLVEVAPRSGLCPEGSESLEVHRRENLRQVACFLLFDPGSPLPGGASQTMLPGRVPPSTRASAGKEVHQCPWHFPEA